jgi:hypothetical protein
MSITANSVPLFPKTNSKGDKSLEAVGSNYLKRASGFLNISLGPINPFIAL